MSVGKRIATGRLRVDASRAVSKLRDYQLSDPRTWPREVVRAANAMGATSVRAFGDADDVWIAWEGETVAIEDLRSLLNELVSPSAASERRGLRLLAIGVNTALGLGPRWLDLYSLSPEGASKVRYTAKILEPSELGEDGVGLDAVKRVAKPHAELFASGGAIHFRRYPGFEALRLFVRGAEPPELEDLRWACRNLPVPHEIGDALAPDDFNDLVRTELGMGLDGFVALVGGTPQQQGVVLDFAELGVHLAQRVTQEGGHHGPPLRLYLDAPRLPTNASRSEVRLEDSPVRDAVDRLGRVMPDLVKKIIAKWEAEPSEPLRFAIIRLISAYASGARWHAELAEVPEVFHPLLKLRVLRNGVGKWCAFDDFGDTLEIVHRSATHEPEVLEPWLHNVLWAAPGFPEAQLLGDWGPPDTSDYVAQARRNLVAWEKWFAQPMREPTIPHEPGQWVTLDVGSVPYPATRVRRAVLEWEGARGQVTVFGTETSREGHVRLQLEGRPIADVMVSSPIPFRAVLEVPGLQPLPSYTGVVQDETHDEAIALARAAAIAGVELVAGKHLDPSRALPSSVDMRDTSNFDDLALLRRGQVALVAHHCGPAPESHQDIERLFARGPLANVACWQLAHHGGRVETVSIRQLFAHVRKQPELICVSPEEAGAPAGRVAVVADGTQRAHLRVLLDSPTVVVYVPPSKRPTARELGGPRDPTAVTLYVTEETRRGAVVYSRAQPMVRRSHGGRSLDQRAYSSEYVPVSINCDDDGLVPGPLMTLDPIDAFDPAAWEAEWLRAVADHLCGTRHPDLEAPDDALKVPGLRRDLVVAMRHHGVRRALGKERFEALLELPLVPRVDAEPVSLTQLKSQSRLEYLLPNESERLPLDGWEPVEAEQHLADAIGQILGRNVHHATARLDAIREKAVRQRALELHRTRAKRELPEPGPDEVALSGKVKGIVGLGLTEQLRIEVWLEERPFAQIVIDDDYPIVAIVDIPLKYTRRDLRALSREGEKHVVSTVRRAVPRLLTSLAETSPERLVDEAVPANLLLRWLRDSKRSKARTKLFDVPIFKSVRGKRISVKDACTKQRIRVGRFDGKWVGPADGEDEHVLDGPILELPEGARRDALKLAYESLGHPRKVLDHSRALRELQTERRVAQQLVAAPTIPEVSEGLRASLAELRAASKRKLLGVGEVGLIDAPTSKLRVYGNGELVGEVSFDLKPAVCIATESLALAESMREGKKVSAGKQGKTLLHALLTHKIIGEIDKLPRWVARAVRLAFATGVIQRKELRGAAIFETTADEWKDYRTLLDQQERFGDIWYTPDARPGERNRQPLDRARLAFRLSDEEAIGIGKRLELVDASEELRLDERCRRNGDRPIVESFELPPSLRDVLLGTHHWKHQDTEILLGVLPASHAAYAGIHVHCQRRLVCVRRMRGWPVIAFVEDPKLELNRTWDDVVEDRAYRRLEERIRKRAKAIFDELVTAPDDVLVSYRPELSFIRRDLEVDGAYGVFWLDPEIRNASVAVYAKTNRSVTLESKGVSLPLFGFLHVAHIGVTSRDPRIESFLRRVYAELISRVVRKLQGLEGEQRDGALAHVVLATGSGYYEPSTRARELELSCFHPEPRTLGDLQTMLEKREAIDAFDAADLNPDRPGLVRDGSETAQAVEQALGRLVRAKRIQLALPRRRQREREPMAPVEVPLQALGARLLSRLAELGYGHLVAGLVVMPDEDARLLGWRGDTHRLAMAGRHPMLERLEAARVSRSPEFDSALSLLAMHAIALVNHHSEQITDATVSTALMGLLREE